MKKDGLRVKTEEILAQRHLFSLVRYSLILTFLDKTTSSLAIHASCRLGSGLFAVWSERGTRPRHRGSPHQVV